MKNGDVLNKEAGAVRAPVEADATLHVPMSLSIRAAGSALCLVIIAYVGVFLYLSPLLLQDLPNHIARAFVLADLIFRQGREFGQVFQFHFLFTPYVLGDLCLATLVRLVGVSTAAGLWAVLAFLSLPCALFAYLRARRAPRDVTVLMLLFGVYLSTDNFFLLGFLEFRFAIAVVLFALALVESLRRCWSGAKFAAFACVVVIAYLTHLAAVAFIATGVVASAVMRMRTAAGTSSIGREASLLIPVGCVLAWHVLVASGFRQPQDVIGQTNLWGTIFGKVTSLQWDFFRYSQFRDRLMLAALAVCLMICVRERRAWTRALLKPEVVELWGTALAFLGLYAVLPSEYSEASHVDIRALVLVPLFFILGLLHLPDRTPVSTSRVDAPAVGFAVVLAICNLVYLTVNLRADSVWLTRYRDMVSNIPERSTVLPVYTAKKTGNTRTRLHAASFAVIDRAALIPYLFSADLGDPMKYFRYSKWPYAPDETWYNTRADGDVDWKKVAGAYQFLLVMKPYDADRIPIATRTVAENTAAALLAVQ